MIKQAVPLLIVLLVAAPASALCTDCLVWADCISDSIEVICWLEDDINRANQEISRLGDERTILQDVIVTLLQVPPASRDDLWYARLNNVGIRKVQIDRAIQIWQNSILHRENDIVDEGAVIRSLVILLLQCPVCNW